MTISGHRYLVAAAVVAAVFMAIAGCRTPVEPEGTLDAQPFERPGPSLVTGQGGNWFVIARRGNSPKPFLTVKYDGHTHLFATAPVGERSAEILPVSRVNIDWFNDALEATPRLHFHDDIREIAVDDHLGRWNGGDDERIFWMGDEPQGAQRAVVVPADFDLHESRSLAAHIAGTVDIDESGIKEIHEPLSEAAGPYFVIADGPVTEAGPRSLSTASNAGFSSIVDQLQDQGAITGWSFDTVTGPGVGNAAELRELAGEHSVELMIADDGDGVRLGFSPDAGPPARGQAQRPVAVAESGFNLRADVDSPELSLAIRVADDLYKDYPLSAAYRLHHLDDGGSWHVDENDRATTLRHQDLMAAAGYAPWMRSHLVEGAQGLGPDAYLYFVRAVAYLGRWEAVLHYGDRALRLFSDWPTPAGSLGMARTRRWIAEAHLARDNETAAVNALERARADYLRGQDPYRAALVERRLRLLDPGNTMEGVVDDLQQAGAHYEASRTYLLAAAYHLQNDDYDAGLRQLEAWSDRFADRAPRRLLSLYWALSVRVDWHNGLGTDIEQSADRALEAKQSRAWDAAVIFALNRHIRRGISERIHFTDLGHLLVEGSRRSDSRLFEEEVDSILGVICADVVFSSESRPTTGVLPRRCDRQIDQFMESAGGISSLLDGGYRFIQRGDLSAAQALGNYVIDHLPEGGSWAIPVAAGHLFEAARLIESRNPDWPGRSDDEQRIDDAIERSFQALSHGLDTLNRELSGEELPAVLRAFGDEFDVRGFERLSLMLYDASRQAAIDAGADGVEYDSALALAMARHRTEQWDDLAAMQSVASPLHASRIGLYRGHAQKMVGNEEAGQSLITQTIEEATQFGELQRLYIDDLAIELALERRQLDDARQHLDRADRRLSNMSEAVAERDDTAMLAAKIDSRWVRYFQHQGEYLSAQNRADQALERLVELPYYRAPQAWRQALEAAAEVTGDREEFEDLVDQLRAVYRQLPEEAPGNVHRQVARTLARLSIEYDRVDEGMQAVRSILDDGMAMASTRRQHHCLVGMARQFVRDVDWATFHLDRCIDGQSESEMTARAEWLKVLADADARTTYRVDVARHLRDLLAQTDQQRYRIDWMIEFAQPRVSADEQREQRLSQRFEGDDHSPESDEERLWAAVEWIEYLLDTARYQEVDRILQTEAEPFFVAGVDAEDSWQLLRIESMLRQLRPFEARELIEEAGDNLSSASGEDRARLHYFRAVAHLQLDQYFPAQESIERGLEVADADSTTAEKLDALESTARSSRFGP